MRSGAGDDPRLTTVTTPVVVIPCFDEERRLDHDALLALGDSGTMRLLLVDDGSTDGTLASLRALARHSSGIDVLVLAENSGKAEAVRHGLRHAIEAGAEIVAYYDADLSTPPEELRRLLATLDLDPRLVMVMASRVRLLGLDIERRAHRHYLGRVFATFASLALSLPVYDTQCGAKALRVTPALRAALETPFRSSWAFDVELIGRLLHPVPGVAPTPVEAIVELPLRRWHDVPGSKLGPTDMGRAALELAHVARDTRRRRRVAGG